MTKNNSGQAGGAAVHKSARAKKKKRRVILFAAELLVLAGLLVWVFTNAKMDKIQTDEAFESEDVKNEELTEETKDVLGEYTTIALFGLDNRDSNSYNSGNSDVIMVARIDKDTKEVRLVSIYRDTYLKMADLDNTDAYSKANAAYAVGGPKQAVRMLNTNLDLDIQEYVSFDFDAVAEAVDILGGVEIPVTEEECVHLNNYCIETSEVTGKSYDPLPGEGTYNLNGVQAVSYGRIRYTAGDDFKRTERQRLVVNKMVEKALASDIGTVNKLIDAVFPKIKTSLGKTEIAAMAMDAFHYKLGDTAGFPFAKKNKVVDISYQKADADCVIPVSLSANVKQLHDFLYGNTSYKVTDSVESISNEIMYRTGVTGESSD
ncbi:LytR family transcriptional regulator [Lachnospiraceae bacterium]|nr:LytR family transcriptional regulator [Lachnospiraceae bacterium]